MRSVSPVSIHPSIHLLLPIFSSSHKIQNPNMLSLPHHHQP
uniref:Uncharacterized protein n=1 Tax=Rhizophora mucronata TaxID=61149 RepID=A0A2P2P8G2_RHIMU